MPGKTNFHAVATIRDAIAYAETNRRPCCEVSLDFKLVFDRISNTYLLTVLRSYGFDAGLIEFIRMTYGNATLVIHFTGYMSTPIRIQCGMRKGCPLT